MLTLTHKTTRDELEALTRDELKRVLTDAGFGPGYVNKLNKGERVDLLITKVKELQKDHERQEELKAQCKANAISQELKDERITAVLKGHAAGLGCVIDEAVSRVEKFKKTVAESNSLSWSIGGRLEKALEDEHFANALRGLHSAVERQLKERTMTFQEIRSELQQELDAMVDGLMSDSDYRHNSTSEFSSIDGRAKFAAKQRAARTLKQAVKAVDDAMEQMDPKHAEVVASLVRVW